MPPASPRTVSAMAARRDTHSLTGPRPTGPTGPPPPCSTRCPSRRSGPIGRVLANDQLAAARKEGRQIRDRAPRWRHAFQKSIGVFDIPEQMARHGTRVPAAPTAPRTPLGLRRPHCASASMRSDPVELPAGLRAYSCASLRPSKRFSVLAWYMGVTRSSARRRATSPITFC